jgi:hypothetical protein
MEIPRLPFIFLKKLDRAKKKTFKLNFAKEKDAGVTR